MNGTIRLALELLIKSTVLAFCVGAILRTARIRSAAVCHAAWLCVLAGMILMPVLSSVTPSLPVPVPFPMPAADAQFAQTQPQFATITVSEPGPASAGAKFTPARRSAPARSTKGFEWTQAIFGVYLTGFAFLLVSLAAGWRAARKISRASVRVLIPGVEAVFFESALVNAPLTVGVLSPRIVLPCSWRKWTEHRLRAVLAHEAVHVRQRHGLVSLMAQLNRCVFWFHPLSWWLERKLAITAEFSCDDAGVRATGQCREYAQVLLEIAETVGRQGRFSLAGIGMHGAGALEERINRLVEGDLSQYVSRTRRATVAAGCVASIFAVAACRQQSVAPQQGPDHSAEIMAEVNDLSKLRVEHKDAERQSELEDVRGKLEKSENVKYLLSGGTQLVSMHWPTTVGPAAGPEEFAIGKAAVQRALKQDPNSAWARQLMNKIRDQELVVSLPEKIWSGPLESRHEAILALPDGDRFRELSLLAMKAGDEAVRATIRDRRAPLPDPAREKAFWAQAGGYAKEALDLAPQAKEHPDYAISLFRANMTAGMAALVAGDKKVAVEFADKAFDAPPSEALQYPIVNARPWVNNWNFPVILVARLVREDDRDAAVEILDRYSRLIVADREKWVKATETLRQGTLPPGWDHY